MIIVSIQRKVSYHNTEGRQKFGRNFSHLLSYAILAIMDARTLRVLEFDRIRERLAEHTSFSLGRERALALTPTDDIHEARDWQAEIREARRLLEEKSDVHLGGVHDLRPLAEQAARGGTLLPSDLLNIRSTLTRAHPAANAGPPGRSVPPRDRRGRPHRGASQLDRRNRPVHR